MRKEIVADFDDVTRHLKDGWTGARPMTFDQKGWLFTLLTLAIVSPAIYSFGQEPEETKTHGNQRHRNHARRAQKDL